jgi:Ca-activated chloride channel family protein
MSFVSPHFLWILGIPIAIFAYFILTHKDKLEQVFDQEVLKRLSIGDDALPLSRRNFLLILSLIFMLLALARPVIDHGDRVVNLEGLSAVVALDISGSMRSKDFYPNRLEFAKKKIGELLDEMPNDEVSLVAFAYSSFMLAPFSSDKASLKLLVSGVNDQYINMTSTDFTALGNFTVELLEKRKQRILILFSDGGDKKDLRLFRNIIKEKSIALYVVLVGTKEGAPVVSKEGKALMQNGKIVLTQRNDELGEIAMESGGAYITAHSGKSDIEKLVETIKSDHHLDNRGEVVIHDREEFFYYPLGVGLLFLFLGVISVFWRRG